MLVKDNIISVIIAIVLIVPLITVIVYLTSNKFYTFIQFHFSSDRKARVYKKIYVSSKLRENFSEQDNVVSEDYMRVSNGGPLQAITNFDIRNYGNNNEIIIKEEELRFW